MIKINLLPVREKAKEENIRKQISVGALLIVLSLIIMGYFLFIQYSELNDLKDRKVKAEQELANLKKDVGDLNQLKQKREALEKRKEAIASLSENRLGVVRALDYLTRDKPKSLYFTSLDQKSGAAPWEDFGVTVQGVATDNEIVAQYMRDLQKEKTFGSVDLDYTKAKTVKKDAGSFQEFAVNLRVVQKQPTPSPQESKSTGPAPAPAKKTTPAPPAKTGK